MTKVSPLGRLRAWLMDDGRDNEPPARVLETIRAQQDRSEILVSVVQLLSVIFFATLYGTAPMAQGQVQFVTLATAIEFVASLFAIDIESGWLQPLRTAASHVQFVFGV